MLKRFYKAIKYELVTLKNINKSGLLIPTSDKTIGLMLSGVITSETKIIVELGAGNGNITRKILEVMPLNTVLLAFEISEECKEFLTEIKDKRLIIIQDTAEKIDYYLQSYGFAYTNVIISTLPLSVFSDYTRNSILNHISTVMNSESKLVQMRYFSFSVLKSINKHFNIDNTKYSFFNLPPTFLHFCSIKGNNITK